MKHPELLLLPVFMLADYFLTLAGAIQAEKKYSHHFQTEQYELNPAWQQNVARRKWFSPRHLLITFVSSAILIAWAEQGLLSEIFLKSVSGCLLVLYGAIIGRHLSNLLTFRRLIRNPGDISGQVSMSHAFVLHLSLCQSLVVLIPILVVAIFEPGPFVTGALAGILLFMLLHFYWIQKYRRQKRFREAAALDSHL